MSDSRGSLIDHGLRLLVDHGYDGVGLGAILDAAGVPKGSFYYFFESKEDFALAVLDAYAGHYAGFRQSILQDASTSPMQRLTTYFEELERIHLESPRSGCLYGVFAQTVSVRSRKFQARLAAMFTAWNAQLQHVLKEAQAVGEIDPRLDPAEVAAFLIDAYEGAVLRMKVDGGSDAFGRFKRFALGLFTTGLSAAERQRTYPRCKTS